ncbi:kinase-like domain-containing protein [Apiospora arundinis]
MTYTPPDNNLAPIDFALKTSSKEEDKNLRREARMMEKVQRAAHCVQIIHSSGKSPLDPPNPDDSSDGATDAESSGDESVDAQPPPRLPRASRSLAERQAKLQKHTNRVLDNNWLVAVRLGRVKAIDEARRQGKPIPKPHWKFPDPMLDLDRRDFIFMEYLPLGICRKSSILWSFWLCLVRACIAMAYPPRKFHPMRKRHANPRQYRGLERRTWDFDPKRLLLEEIPPEQKRWRKKRMVHMDIDPTNIFLGPAKHAYDENPEEPDAPANEPEAPANQPDAPANQPGGVNDKGKGKEEVAKPIPAAIDITMEDMLKLPNEEPEHEIIPMLKLADFGLAQMVKPNKRDGYYIFKRDGGKHGHFSPEQFCPDWDYIPVDRDGNNIVNEPVAGNFDSHTNVWQSALTMWQLITYYKPPRPPRLRTRLVRDQELRSYSLLLDEEKYRDVDFELRSTIFNCLRHVPSERPSLQFLLDQALKGVARRSTGDATEGEIRGWVQRYVYDA